MTATVTRAFWAVALGGLLLSGCGKPEWVELVAGGTRTCARADDGQLRCWGGKLVQGGSVPQLQGSNEPVAPPKLEGATSLCAGQSFVCARVVGGTVKCLAAAPESTWGEVGGLNDVSMLACADGGGCAQTAGGEVACWSWTDTGAGSVVTVKGLADVSGLAVGGGHRCAVRADRTVVCWGRNGAGQLGVPPEDVAQSDRPVELRGVTDAVSVAAGRHFTCAASADGKVRCAGDNLVGQLGYPGPSTHAAVEVRGVEGAVEVTAGEYHACARLSSGEVRCWGRNLNGQLGDRTGEDRKESVLVTGLVGATRVAAGTDHTCAMGVPGELYCWGANAAGQLGDGTHEDRQEKTKVKGFGG